MSVIKRSLTVVFVFITLLGVAQELPPIHNFSPFDYNSGTQNWSISQSADKRIYVANNEGLLEFDRAEWTLYLSPNETIMRSVKVIGERIYTGCYMEFGFWERTQLGVLEYTSLSQNLKSELLPDEEFWNIIGKDNRVVFQSLKRIYIYDLANGEVGVIDSQEKINKTFVVGDDIYFQRMNHGVFRILNGKETKVINDALLKTAEIINIFPLDKGILIVTRNEGLFHYVSDTLREIENNIVQELQLSNLGIYSAIQLNNGRLVLGTISYGLIFLDENMEFSFQINQNNGLQNNTILSLFEDQDNNIWAGLDNGVSYINVDAPIRVFKDNKGIIGSVYASAIHGGNLYLGTNQGLFYKELYSEDDFKLISKTQGQVWCLKEIDGTLFCGHNDATYMVSGNQVKMVSEIQGTWNLQPVNDHPDLVIQGNYDGLYVLERFGSSWRLRNKIKGFDNSSRYFEVLGTEIFVNHEYKGVFKLNVDSTFSRVIDIHMNTLLKGANSGISKYRDAILYAGKGGIYQYDETEKAFKKDSLLSTSYDEKEYISGRIVLGEEGDRFWFFAKNHLILVSSSILNTQPNIKKLPLTIEVRRDVPEYENIINLDGTDKFLMGTNSGYLIININELKTGDFKVDISKINSGINKDHSASTNLIDKTVKGSFDYNENDININFYTPEYYQYFEPLYQYQLLGIYDLWSEWTPASNVFYENLPYGEYTFNVRSKLGGRISENVATYSFVISRPWYISTYMWGLYILLAIFISVFTHQVYKRYYRFQQYKLMEANKRELELAKLQGEQEIIKLKNEQLKQDIKNKSNEAAASAISIVKKNELLMQIKDQLLEIGDKKTLAPVIKVINKNLSHDENWEMFKEAFDSADSEFFKKVKAIHPDLSPNELKLCAYLRLNLSSKEIAPLFNISPRSVEVKRYRLRQKMNLGSQDNLTNYILNI